MLNKLDIGESKRLKRRIDIGLCIVNSLYYLSMVFISGFIKVLLQSRNFTNTQIALTTSLGPIIAVIVQPFVASYLDKNYHIPLKRAISAILLIALTSAALLIVLPSTLFTVMLLYIIINTCMFNSTGLINALAMQYKNIGIPINFGLSRGLGSLAYGITALLLGMSIQSLGTGIILPAYCAVILLTVISIVLTLRPDKVGERIGSDTNLSRVYTRTTQSIWCMLKNNKALTLLLAASILSFLSQGAIEIYLIDILRRVGGTSADLGIALFIYASSELLPLFCFSFLIKKFSSHTLIKVAFFSLIIRSLGLLFAPSLFMVFIILSLNMFGTGLYWPSSVYLVNDIVQGNEKVRGQALTISAVSGIAKTIGIFVSGILLDWQGVPAILIFCTFGTVLGYFVISRCIKLLRKP